MKFQSYTQIQPNDGFASRPVVEGGLRETDNLNRKRAFAATAPNDCLWPVAATSGAEFRGL